MQLLEAHPFRWIRERPRLAPLVRGDMPFGRYDECDLVDFMEGNLGRNLDEALMPFVPAAAQLPEPDREAYRRLERTAAVSTSRFFRYGRNVYAPTSELVRALLRTDLHHVQLGDLRWPHDVFHLAFRDTLGMTLPGTDAVIDGMTFDLRNLTDEGRPSIQVLLTTRGVAIPAGRIRDPRQATPVHALTLAHGTTLTGMLDEEIELQVRGLVDLPPGVDRGVEEARLRASRDVFKAALSVAFNVIAYMTAEPEDLAPAWPDDAPIPVALRENPSKVPIGTRNRLLGEGFVQILVVGGSLAREAVARGVGYGQELVNAHWRRGHWRRQRHGQALSLVALRWIRPLLVRPDLPEGPRSHLYVDGVI